MSKAEKIKRFASSLNRETDWEIIFAKNIFYVEKELHVFVDLHYPLMKLLTQIELLREYGEELERQRKN